MNWIDTFFKKKTIAAEDARLKLGRYSDNDKEPHQYEAWKTALQKYDAGNYIEAFKKFLEYLRDDTTDNVRWQETSGGLKFELLQGSKRISGTANAEKFSCSSHIAHADQLNVTYMRQLVEANYFLYYARYALDDNNNLTIQFDTHAVDASPYKLYAAVKEVAINADKQDDLLLDEFNTELIALDSGSRTELSELEKEKKYAFLRAQIEKTFSEMDKGGLDVQRYPGGVAYMLLSLAYRLDFLLIPQGYMLEAFQRIERLYFDSSIRSTSQKNLTIRREFQQISDRTKEQTDAELYNTTATFGVLPPKTHEVLVQLIDGELKNMDWYEQNAHENVAMAVPDFIVGNALFNYTLPQPDRAFLELYFRITQAGFFRDLNINDELNDVHNGQLIAKNIKAEIKKIAEKYAEKYPRLQPDISCLDFKKPCLFARSYLMMLKALDVTPKNYPISVLD